MKELSIEQKAQRYDEAIESGKSLLSDNKIGNAWIYKLLPELAESEDEKIKKWLIALIKSNEYGSISNVGEMPCPKLKVLAWLEKQGEHANFRNKIQIGDKVTRNEDGVLVNLSQLNRVAKKQGEQKPLFKEGDTVIWDGEEFNILDVTKDSYNVGGYVIPIYRQNELSLKQKPADKVEPKFHEGEWVTIKE